MARIPVQMARMSATDLATYVGPPGEQVWNTDTKRTHFQDGSTPNGFPTRLLSDGLAGEVLFNAAQVLTDVQKAQVQSNIGVVGNRDGCCRLSASASDTLRLDPYDGERLVINGRSYIIPAAGVTFKVGTTAPASGVSILTGQSLTTAATYLVYAFIDAGGVMQLELSTTSRGTYLGTQVKANDASRRLVGQVKYSNSNSFTAVTGQVQNWFNKQPLISSTGVNTTTQSTGDAFLGASVGYLAWAGQYVDFYASGYGNNSVQGQYFLSKIYSDVAAQGTLQAVSTESVATAGSAYGNYPMSPIAGSVVNGDGWHQSAIYGRVQSSSSQSQFIMNNYVKTMG